MTEKLIKNAIQSLSVIEFSYDGGTRVVEPHMLGVNEADNQALSGWFVAGDSVSGGQGWREYLVSKISDIVIRDENFEGARPGYNPTGGKKFPVVIARI